MEQNRKLESGLLVAGRIVSPKKRCSSPNLQYYAYDLTGNSVFVDIIKLKCGHTERGSHWIKP